MTIKSASLREYAIAERPARANITAYDMPDGRTVHVIAQGRLVNLAAGDGHPAEIMDLSFGVQFFSAMHILNKHQELKNEVYVLPEEVDTKLAQIKLASLGVTIDELTQEQKDYLGI